MSLVPLLDKALAADLSKSEWRAFAALLRQTVGFNKISDALTFGRLAQLTGLRKDHLKPAVQGVLKAGLFSQSAHPDYEFMYTVAHAESIKPKDVTHTNEGNNTKTEINYPKEIDHETQQALSPALAKLRSSAAQDVCDLLALAIRNRSIQTTPVRFGFALISAAKNGTLDKTALRSNPQQPAQAPNPQPKAVNKQIDDDFFYRNLAKIQGKTLETIKAEFANAHKKATVPPVALSNY
ncbi:phage replication protein O [Thiothrix eikelboomii]|uniref:Phage replication protein O n=1 Tax=Thiothrix eikelboomii TaxID=92487 RepID=A0A1T4WW18_9GAMM|nr:replication protein [Thiothrix eikelboomii]SKA81058.1 phage replication protein O [Thiothrix eikelboomii]